MLSIKKRLRKWLVPEYEVILEEGELISQIKDAIGKDLSNKNITIDNPVALLGNMADCHVNVKPTIHVKVTLASVDLAALLEMSGNQQMVTSCFFQGESKTAKHLKED